MISLQTHMLPLFCVVLLFSKGNTLGDSVLQNQSIFLTEEDKTSLYCKYESTSSNPSLFWYIQLENKIPELLLSEYSQKKTDRFQAHHYTSNKTFNLEIRGTQGDSVLQNSTMVLAENEKASLYCLYDTTDTAPYLYWYIQLGNTSPELILSNLNVKGKAFKEGFKASPDKSAKTFNLEIAAAGLSDAATYYCALSPTLC
ncbi:hypothetical protein JZ751_025850, partial [Albula glossodonta]